MCHTTPEDIVGKTASKLPFQNKSLTLLVQLGESPAEIAGCLRAMKTARDTGQPVTYEIAFNNDQKTVFWASMLPVGGSIPEKEILNLF